MNKSQLNAIAYSYSYYSKKEWEQLKFLDPILWDYLEKKYKHARFKINKFNYYKNLENKYSK